MWYNHNKKGAEKNMEKIALDNPPDELKIYELSLIWKEAAYNFAFWEKLLATLDWDKAYRDALTTVLKTRNLHEYYLELMKFTALLRDGHTGVYFPQSVQQSPEYTSKLPIRVAYSNGTHVVSNVKKNAARVIKRWSVVKKVNGIDFHAYLEKNVFPYIWHEKLDSADYLINEFFSNGPKDSQLEFEFDYGGETYTAELTRTKGDTDWMYDSELKPDEDLNEVYKSDSHKIAMTHDQIAVITIDSMRNSDLPKEFYANFPLLEKAQGCVIDIRYNTGGNSGFSDAVAAMFLGNEFQNQRYLHPIHIGAYKAWEKGVGGFSGMTWDDVVKQNGGEPNEWLEKTYKIPRHMYYESKVNTIQVNDCPGVLTAPLVVLTTAKTGSAAEDFLVVLEHAKRATFVGTPSYGSTGNPLQYDLESGGSVRICTRHNTHIDGREFTNIGVLPHVHFEPSLEDLKQGIDSQMGKGLETVRAMIG